MSERRSDPQTPLAVVCAGGSIPFEIAESLKSQDRPFVLFAVKGVTDPDRVSQYRHHWVGMGQMARFERLARMEGCRDIVFIGSLQRPALWSIRFDLKALLRLPKIIAAFRGGDDHLLRNIGRLFEADGFRVIGAHEVAPQLLMPNGILTRRVPSERDRADIAQALKVLAENSARDLGQAAVVADGRLVALEGDEGTDHMLEKLTALRSRDGMSNDGIGVLVKAPKTMQDRRYDLPAIGPRTVASASRAGLAGIAVVAGEGVVAELNSMIEAANREHIFIVGIKGIA